MAGVRITIPGIGGQIEAKKARIDAAVKFHWNLATAPPEKKVRRPSAGDLGKRFADGKVGMMRRDGHTF